MTRPVFRPTTPRDVSAIDQRVRRLERRWRPQTEFIALEARGWEWDSTGVGNGATSVNWNYLATTSSREIFGTCDGTMVDGDYISTDTIGDWLVLMKTPGVYYAQAILQIADDGQDWGGVSTVKLFLEGAGYAPFGAQNNGNSFVWGGVSLPGDALQTPMLNASSFYLTGEAITYNVAGPIGTKIAFVQPQFYDSLGDPLETVVIEEATMFLTHWYASQPLVDLWVAP